MENEVENEEENRGVTLKISKKVNNEWGDTESTYETFKVVKKY